MNCVIDCLDYCRYKLVSTGGTATALEKAGFPVTRVEELTSFPEMVTFFERCVTFSIQNPWSL